MSWIWDGPILSHKSGSLTAEVNTPAMAVREAAAKAGVHRESLLAAA
jgi:hypothetical protein